jgi:hypothetical protein
METLGHAQMLDSDHGRCVYGHLVPGGNRAARETTRTK